MGVVLHSRRRLAATLPAKIAPEAQVRSCNLPVFTDFKIARTRKTARSRRARPNGARLCLGLPAAAPLQKQPTERLARGVQIRPHLFRLTQQSPHTRPRQRRAVRPEPARHCHPHGLRSTPNVSADSCRAPVSSRSLESTDAGEGREHRATRLVLLEAACKSSA